MPRPRFALRAVRLWVLAAAMAAASAGGGCISIPLNAEKPTVYYQVAGKGDPVVYLMRVDGIITGETSFAGLLRGERVPSTVERVRYELERLDRDGVNLAGLLIRVNSPGGTVTAADIIHHELAAFKKRRGIPVVALMMDIAASGGYYIAMPSDTIVAHPTTTTGSLGVIMPSINVSGLLTEYGVLDTTIASGAHKDLGSPAKPPNAEDAAILQSVVDDLYARFMAVVKQGRGDRLKAPLEQLADGRIYSARQAQKVGLVDRVGYFEDALTEMQRLTGLATFRVLTLQQQESGVQANIYMAPPQHREGPLAALPLAGFDVSRAPFYYLWLPR